MNIFFYKKRFLMVTTLLLSIFIQTKTDINQLRACPSCVSGVTGSAPAMFCNVVAGSLCTTGNAQVSGNLTVCGQATFGGPRTISLDELRSIGCTGPTLEVEVLGDEGISGNLFVCGTITAGGFSGPGIIGVTGAVGATGATGPTGATGVGIMSNDALCNLSVGDNTNPINNGAFNTAVGEQALQSNISGQRNTVIGCQALQSATACSNNVVIGEEAMGISDNCNDNVAVGEFAMFSASNCNNNVGVGEQVLEIANGANFNVAIGNLALSSLLGGTGNIALGTDAGGLLGENESNNIYIGNVGKLGESSTIRIGASGTHTACYVQGINGATTTLPNAPVMVDGNGQLGTMPSAREFKKDIKDINGEQDKVLALRPVSFIYKFDEANLKQYGLIAEEVNEVCSDLVIQKDGKIYTVNYMALIPLLLKQIQELEKSKQIQENKLHELEEKMAYLV